MEKGVARLIIERAKRDPEFKKKVLATLRKNLKALERAIEAITKLK
jgi:hypothetical protein